MPTAHRHPDNDCSIILEEPHPVFALDSAKLTPAIPARFRVVSPGSVVTVREPSEVENAGLRVGLWLRIDPSELIVTETPLLNCDQIAEAEKMLVGDGIFEDTEWPGRFSFAALPPDMTARFGGNRGALLRAGIKFGWAVEQAARIFREASARHSQLEVEVVLDADSTCVSAIEHAFIALELRRRGLEKFVLSLNWPGIWEPAIDFLDEAADVEPELMEVITVANGCPDSRPGFRHAEEKLKLLPILARQLSRPVHLSVSGVGWLETLRFIAQTAPALLRRILPVAQERFIFDKPVREIATTEDEVRTLPDVPDEDLEKSFLDDFRGRQLLVVTAQSIMADEALAGEVQAIVTQHRDLLAERVGQRLQVLLQPWNVD